MDDDNTVLTVACRYNEENKNENIIKYLIDHRAEANIKGNQHILLNDNNHKNTSDTPLIISCRFGNENIVKYLIDHGANINEIKDDGNTELTVAFGFIEYSKYDNIIKYLIENGADVNKKGTQKMSINNNNNERYAKYIKVTLLIIACKYCKENIVKYLVDYGANINEAMNDGNTALTVSCGYNKNNKNESIIRYLIDHGADVNKRGTQYIEIDRSDKKVYIFNTINYDMSIWK